MPNNYKHYVSLMCDRLTDIYDDPRLIEPRWNSSQCVTDKRSYEYEVVDNADNLVCTIPAMTDQGFFIIQGEQKVQLIQEVRLRTEHFLSDNPPCCICNVMNSVVPVKIRISNRSLIQLDTFMIHKDLEGVKVISVYELLFQVFPTDDNIRELILAYCTEDDLTDMCAWYILSSGTVGGSGLDIDDYRETIRSKLFSNMNNFTIRMTVISMTVQCVRLMHGLCDVSDRDHYALKHLRTPGEIFYSMLQACIKSSQINLQSAVQAHIYSCLRRGEVVINGRTHDKMAAQLSKRSPIDAISSVRKVIVPCDENSPNMAMRQIHSSQTGYICPCETPEGRSVGIIKHLAATALISVPVDLKEYIMRVCTHELHTVDIPTWIMLDGAVVGLCSAGDANMTKRSLKHTYPSVSCVLIHNVLKIRSVGGRPIRPLLNIEDHPVDWNDIRPWERMVKAHTIRYVDPVECSQNGVCQVDYDKRGWRKSAYMEIHPCVMLGLTACMVPYAEHNQAARNVFSTAQIKQAQPMIDAEKTCYYLQRPVVSTLIGRAMGIDVNGINLVTCIMSLAGFNQEDAIIFKKSTADRGAFMYAVTKTVRVNTSNPWQHIVDANKHISIISGGVEKQLTDINTMLTSPRLKDVQSVSTGARSTVEISLSEHRDLRVGDKLASRHAQKGVVGFIMNDEDMPFNDLDGMIPDIIINPHAIPSRMTIGQLIESVVGKHCCISGTFGDGTPFLRSSGTDISHILANTRDTVRMRLGTTGELIRTPIAMGVVYYMALGHHAADKMFVRSNGPKSMMSRQPVSGRARGGGLRFGEMEYECLIAHGADDLITGISDNSDMQDVPYCNRCKLVTDRPHSPCPYCHCTTVMNKVPFSYVVFKDLMLASGIKLQTDITK